MAVADRVDPAEIRTRSQRHDELGLLADFLEGRFVARARAGALDKGDGIALSFSLIASRKRTISTASSNSGAVWSESTTVSWQPSQLVNSKKATFGPAIRAPPQDA